VLTLARLRGALEVIAILSMATASILIIWILATRVPQRPSTQVDVTPPMVPISVAGAPQMGAQGAPAVMVIYSDFECPYCRTFAVETLPEIVRLYVHTGALRLVFRNLPLEAQHPLARSLAVAGICAARQGRFWEWHDAVFRTRAPLALVALPAIAENVQLDVTGWETCIADSGPSAQVDQERASARELNIRGTPAFVIGLDRGGESITAIRVLIGAQRIASFRGVLDRILRRAPER
jgi:protein-disulfide isomerase